MLARFRQHWWLKLMAVAFAVFLWFFVHNTTNPVIFRSFSVPLQFEGEPFNGQVRNRNKLVTVMVSGEKARVDAIQAADIHAYVQLKSADVGETELPVRFRRTDTLAGLSLEARPKTEVVEIGQLVNRTFPTRVVLMGDVPESFAITAAPSVTPKTASVSGWKDDVSRVKSIAARVDLNQVKGNVEANYPLLALDESGVPVPSAQVKIVPEEALVRFALTPLPTSKTVYVNVRTTGRPPFPFEVDSILCTPSQVTLTGDPDQLARISVVQTEPVALDSLITSETRSVKLALPPKVQAEGAATVRVRLSVKRQG